MVFDFAAMLDAAAPQVFWRFLAALFFCFCSAVAMPQPRSVADAVGSGCQINRESHMAVCKTTDDISKEPEITYAVATVSSVQPPDGTPMFFTGFPLQSPDPITSIGFLAGIRADSGNYDTLIIDKGAWPGASGSPMFLINGANVVGMLTETGTGQGGGLAFGVTGHRIIETLTQAKARWREEQTNKK